MTFYRIRDWNKHFENNRTRELKRMDWLPVPNKHDGSGFTELMDHPNGMAHYGAWHLILQVASKCDPRGTLLREGAGGVLLGITPHDLARMSHGSAAVFEEVMPRLLSIGWIERCENPAPSCVPSVAPSCGEVPMEWKGMEGNGSTHTEAPASVPPAKQFNSDLAVQQLGKAIADLYHRPEGRPSYLENSMLCEIVRRDGWKAELKEIQTYRDRLPAKEKRYFPQSATSLLSNWQETLDKARVYEPNPQEKSKAAKGVTALCAELTKGL